MLACASVLLMLSTALAVAGGMVVAHRKAQAAADLTALAAAGDPGGCAVASAAAARNHATLVSCVASGREVRVEVTVPGPAWLGWSADLTGRARAGPGGPVEGTGEAFTLWDRP